MAEPSQPSVSPASVSPGLSPGEPVPRDPGLVMAPGDFLERRMASPPHAPPRGDAAYNWKLWEIPRPDLPKGPHIHPIAGGERVMLFGARTGTAVGTLFVVAGEHELMLMAFAIEMLTDWIKWTRNLGERASAARERREELTKNLTRRGELMAVQQLLGEKLPRGQSASAYVSELESACDGVLGVANLASKSPVSSRSGSFLNTVNGEVVAMYQQAAARLGSDTTLPALLGDGWQGNEKRNVVLATAMHMVSATLSDPAEWGRLSIGEPSAKLCGQIGAARALVDWATDGTDGKAAPLPETSSLSAVALDSIRVAQKRSEVHLKDPAWLHEAMMGANADLFSVLRTGVQRAIDSGYPRPPGWATESFGSSISIPARGAASASPSPVGSQSPAAAAAPGLSAPARTFGPSSGPSSPSSVSR